MTFKLRIPGRDENKSPSPANPANPLIQDGSISRLAGLAASVDREFDVEAKRHRSAAISYEGSPYWQADELAGLPAWSDAEITLFEKRQARITWMGCGHIAEQLAESLLPTATWHLVDRSIK